MGSAPGARDRTGIPATALFAVPLFGALAWLVAPVVFGGRHFYLRDVLSVHTGLAGARAFAVQARHLPLFDPFHGGGRPLAGNPNALAFHPALFVDLVAPGRSTDAHLVLHLLLAPLAMFACARALGLRRAGAWTAAAFYTLSGFVLSQLSFVNLIGSAALAPALIAASVALVRGWRPWFASGVVGLTWGLILLSGDPWLAVFSLVLALTAALAMRAQPEPAPAPPRGKARRPGAAAPSRAPGNARRAWVLIALGLVLGTLIAAPQIVETLRLLPLTARGGGLSLDQRMTESWDPRQALEWLVPFAFGRPDVLGAGRFWGHAYYGGVPPLFLSLHAGVLALVAIVACGRPRTPVAWWAWGAIVVGLALALGSFDPIAQAIFSLPPLAAFRYPVKVWIAVATGFALLGGIAADRWTAGDGRALRRGCLTALALGGALIVLAIVLGMPAFGRGLLRALMPRSVEAASVEFERARLAGVVVLQVLIALLGAAALGPRASRARAAAGIVLLHVVSQAILLRPLATTAAIPELDTPPALLAALPESLTVLHAGGPGAFEAAPLHRFAYPSTDRAWTARQAAWALHPFTATRWGRRYELDATPEGLEPEVSVIARGMLARSTDPERVRLLRAWGVGRLVVGHALPDSAGARLVMHADRFGEDVFVYDLPARAPEAYVAATAFPLRSPEAARRLIAHPEFDPRRDAVVEAPEARPIEMSGGTATLTDLGDQRLRVAAEAGPNGGLLVVQRTPALRIARLDGHVVPIRVVNLHRTGIDLPPGRHEVVLDIERDPARRALAAAAAGLVAALVLLGLGLRAGAPRA